MSEETLIACFVENVAPMIGSLEHPSLYGITGENSKLGDFAVL